MSQRRAMLGSRLVTLTVSLLLLLVLIWAAYRVYKAMTEGSSVLPWS